MSRIQMCIGLVSIFDAGCTNRHSVILRFDILKEVGAYKGVKPLSRKICILSFQNDILQCIFLYIMHVTAE